MSEVSSQLPDSQTFDAQQIAENVEAGEQQLPQVNVSADYEASKEFSVSEIDRTGAGAEAAAAATAPKFNISTPAETNMPAQSTGKPEDFLSMAKEIQSDVVPGEVTDDLVQKALDMGTPGS